MCAKSKTLRINMSRLKPDCLYFNTPDGESIPCSAEWVTLELVGDAADLLDSETLRQVAAAALHYFKEELGRNFLVEEFVSALERGLRGLGLTIFADAQTEPQPAQASDLPQLVGAGGEEGELFFLPRLRQEFQKQLQTSPQLVRFKGLRACVKQLAGANRWSRRCDVLNEQIVDYLRACCVAETRDQPCSPAGGLNGSSAKGRRAGEARSIKQDQSRLIRRAFGAMLDEWPRHLQPP